MTSNPLKIATKKTFTSKYSAAQWAQMARDKGLQKHVEAWEEAQRNGWDEEHYRPD